MSAKGCTDRWLSIRLETMNRRRLGGEVEAERQRGRWGGAHTTSAGKLEGDKDCRTFFDWGTGQDRTRKSGREERAQVIVGVGLVKTVDQRPRKMEETMRMRMRSRGVAVSRRTSG